MEIFFDSTVLQTPATGIAKTLINLYENALKSTSSIQFTALHNKPLKYPLPPEIQSIQLGSYITRNLWMAMCLPIYVRAKKPDIVHFPWNGGVPRFLDNINVITTINDVLPLIIPNYFKSRQQENHYKSNIQKSIDRSNLIITISEFSKQEIINNFEVNNEIIVLNPGPTIKSNFSENNFPKFEYFLYVGGYDRRKNIDKLLTVFLKLANAKKLQNKLILTGSKNYFSPHLKKLIEDGVSSGLVEEWGYVSDETLSNLYAHATALIYPSEYEGFGLPPLEAMKLGCPVITTKCTAIPEVCGNAAYYINGMDDLSESLLRLENDAKLRKKLISKGKMQSTKFSWKLSAKLFLDEIEGLN